MKEIEDPRKLRKFQIYVPIRQTQVYEVEAQNKEEARNMWDRAQIGMGSIPCKFGFGGIMSNEVQVFEVTYKEEG